MTSAAHSKYVRRLLRDLANKEQPFSLNELRLILALERATARLIAYRQLGQHLIFKGGFVLLKTAQAMRFTRDLDASAHDLNPNLLFGLVSEALSFDLDDGFWFGDFQQEQMVTTIGHDCTRISCAFQIGDPRELGQKIIKLSRIHIDFGFSDPKPPLTEDLPMLSLLAAYDPVSWQVYPIEYVFAEKLQTVLERRSANSRAKDIFDLVFLFPRCDELNRLKMAIYSVFSHRKTPIPTSWRATVENINPAILRSAWGRMQTREESGQFEDHWDNFLEILGKIDSL